MLGQNVDVKGPPPKSMIHGYGSGAFLMPLDIAYTRRRTDETAIYNPIYLKNEGLYTIL